MGCVVIPPQHEELQMPISMVGAEKRVDVRVWSDLLWLVPRGLRVGLR